MGLHTFKSHTLDDLQNVMPASEKQGMCMHTHTHTRAHTHTTQEKPTFNLFGLYKKNWSGKNQILLSKESKHVDCQQALQAAD